MLQSVSVRHRQRRKVNVVLLGWIRRRGWCISGLESEGEFEGEDANGGGELDEETEFEVGTGGSEEVGAGTAAGLDALRSLWSLMRRALRMSIRLAKTASWSDACTKA